MSPAFWTKNVGFPWRDGEDKLGPAGHNKRAGRRTGHVDRRRRRERPRRPAHQKCGWLFPNARLCRDLRTGRAIRPVTLLSYLLLVLCCSTNLASEKIDLSSPEATINTYCDAESSEIIQQCFHPSIKVEKRSEQRIWTECNIIDKYPTDKVGQY